MNNLELSSLIKTLKKSGISSKPVLHAMTHIVRADFIPPYLQSHAYENTALPIGYDQTISQPYIVALMTQALLANTPKKISDCTILEIGTGSGYQTAILASLVKTVYTIERIKELYQKAQDLLTKQHYTNIHFRHDDGQIGWINEAPFDGIIVTAGTASVPPALLEQLKPQGGRIVIPIGGFHTQNLCMITRTADHYDYKDIEQVRFVPLTTGLG